MIDMFSIHEFEESLPKDKETGKPLWKSLGMDYGEYTYLVPIKDDVNIQIRSSVRNNGFAAPKGKDSIRLYLVDDHGNNLGSKVKRWVTRDKGWEHRLKETLRTLYKWGLCVSPCPTCGKPMKIIKITDKESPNYGRIYTKCFEHGHFNWLK